jgi:hypothetical protein
LNNFTIPPSAKSLTTLRRRTSAAGLHLLLSVLVAAMVAALVFAFWYPRPFREISGGRDLFLLVVMIDVIVGPLITLAVYDVRKPKAELTRDLLVVVGLQLTALAYGLHTVAQARPAVVALETDRLRVVRAIDLNEANFERAPEGLKSLSWAGPIFLSTRKPDARDDQFDAAMRGLAGEDLGMRPEFWLAPSATSAEYAKAAKPLTALIQRYPQSAEALMQIGRSTGVSQGRLGYLPLLARQTDWSALIDLSTGAVVGYVPVDGF